MKMMPPMPQLTGVHMRLQAPQVQPPHVPLVSAPKMAQVPNAMGSAESKIAAESRAQNLASSHETTQMEDRANVTHAIVNKLMTRLAAKKP